MLILLTLLALLFNFTGVFLVLVERALLRTATTFIILLLVLQGCTSSTHIINDSYKDNYHYFYDDILMSNKDYKLEAAFDNNSSIKNMELMLKLIKDQDKALYIITLYNQSNIYYIKSLVKKYLIKSKKSSLKVNIINFKKVNKEKDIFITMDKISKYLQFKNLFGNYYFIFLNDSGVIGYKIFYYLAPI